jgi:hypothetical protein
MSRELRSIHTHALDFWLARSSVVVIVALQLLIVNKLTLGPRWLAPALEAALLIPLSFATAWTQNLARSATTEYHWLTVARRRRTIRGLAVALTMLVTVMNFGALLYLVKALLGGHGANSGQSLLLDALNIWGTNVIAFALWYWNIDRGGPASRGLTKVYGEDFLFYRLPLPVVHQRDGIFSYRHHAPLRASEAFDDGRVGDLAVNSRARCGKGGQHPQLSYRRKGDTSGQLGWIRRHWDHRQLNFLNAHAEQLAQFEAADESKAASG